MIYLDNAATTVVSEKSSDAVYYAMRKCFGNPSALYRFGIDAEKLLDFSRETVAGAIGAKENEIIFTSGATESNNTAIFGAAEIYGKRKKKIVVTAIEHPSVSEAVKKLGERGFEVATVYPDKNGEITSDMLFDAVDGNTFMISAMLVNNETGYILPIESAFGRIKRAYPRCIAHCDCVQGFMKLPINVKALGADLISLSGHKVHAPKGIGALYIKKGIRLAPLLFGGGQQGGLRSGTEATPLIFAFAKSVEELYPTIDKRFEKATELKNYAVKKLEEIGARINSSSAASPYILSVYVPEIKSETVLHYLESKDICVSSGSACSRGKKSRVLEAFGYGSDITDSTVRLSFSHENSFEDIDLAAEEIGNAMNTLVKIKREVKR